LIQFSKELENLIRILKENQVEKKGFKSYLSIYSESFLKNSNSVEIVIEEASLERIHLIQEGIWKKSNKDDWMYRVDPAGYGTLKHIHIARNKNISSKPQFSWTILGKRHDAHKFAATVPYAAKEIAAEVLGLNVELFEAVSW
jgi:hypothetical protein